jgi:NAD(P)-dependent dehydrogenase (short-subunit alcohol dehydrogenase family)
MDQACVVTGGAQGVGRAIAARAVEVAEAAAPLGGWVNNAPCSDTDPEARDVTA